MMSPRLGAGPEASGDTMRSDAERSGGIPAPRHLPCAHMLLRPFALVALFAFAAALTAQSAAGAQQPDSARTVTADPPATQSCIACPHRSAAKALGEAMLVNILVNRTDYWVGRIDWAGVQPRNWKK